MNEIIKRIIGQPSQSVAFGRKIEKQQQEDGDFKLQTRGRSRSADSERTLCGDDEHAVGKEEGQFSRCLLDGCERGISIVNGEPFMNDTELYHRLQNMAQYPSAIVLARRKLLQEIEYLLNEHQASAKSDSILSLSAEFDEETLTTFISRQHDSTACRYAKYAERRHQAYRDARSAGQTHQDARKAGMEMFYLGTEQCKRWLRQASVVKYVDGSWLAHTCRTTTSVKHNNSIVSVKEQRRAARASWLVMSEELGDGDLERNHVAIYERLMDSISEVRTPKGEEESFQMWQSEIGENLRCWRAAVLQLCLSISPNEFLPEILGFNLAYESLPYHLLVSSREIEELLGHDMAYYFWLHVSIDNADSGHSAMARLAVISFIRSAQHSGGKSLADEKWARVKLGYALADAVPTTPLLDLQNDLDDTPVHMTRTPIRMDQTKAGHSDEITNQLTKILCAKTKTSSQIHASVQARIAGRSIAEWLNPEHAEETIPAFLVAVSKSPAWIVAGRPDASRLVRQFEWGGKMFGALTESEVKVLRLWVENLGEEEIKTNGDNRISKSLQVFRSYISQTSGDERLRWTMAPDHELLPVETHDIHMLNGPDAKVLFTRIMSKPDAGRQAMAEQDKILKDLQTSLRPIGHIPAILNQDQINNLLPTLLCTTAPLEQIISASCGRLASPLGMACVKILRILLGLAESACPSTKDCDRQFIGCQGVDDVNSDQMGVWEVVQAMRLGIQSEQDDTTLACFTKRPWQQLVLPATVLMLSADVWRNMPVLLGLSKSMVDLLLRLPEAEGSDLHARAQLAHIWLEHAIKIGAESEGVRGLDTLQWQERIQHGQEIATGAILQVLR